MRPLQLLCVWTIFVVADTLAQLGFKLSAARLHADVFTARWWRMAFASLEIWLSASSLLIAFLCWLAILRHSSLGPAFAATSLTLVTVVAASAFWLGEPFSLAEGLGSLLILSGVFLLQDFTARRQR